MTQSARTLAFQTLRRVYQDDAYTNLALQHTLSTSRLAPRDKALVTELVYGTVRRQITLDALLSSHVRRPLKDLDGDVLIILRMSVYQLAFLTKVPAYAVIDEAVELAKRYVRRASGLVNGVLRSFTREQAPVAARLDDLLQKRRANRAQGLSIRHGYPLWMVDALLPVYGEEQTAAILAAGNQPAPLTVRVNCLANSVADVSAGLAANAIEVEPGRLSERALRIQTPLDVEQLSWFQEGGLTLQDEGAMLVAPLLKAEPGMRVLDMCAAPGGKTTHIAELQSDQGEIVAYDVYMQKVKTIQAAAARLNLHSIRAKLGDARRIAAEPPYDAVLVDAPCSGLGVMRRRPDLRHRRQFSDIAALTKLQEELLTAAWRAVKPGGVVVYATCTLLPAENVEVVRKVLAESGGALVLEDIAEELPLAVRPDVQEGFLLTPDRFLTDGFYMARLRRK